MLLTNTIDSATGTIIPVGRSPPSLSLEEKAIEPEIQCALPRPDAVWFHGVTEGKERDAEVLCDDEGAYVDGRFFVAELPDDHPRFPAYVLNVAGCGRPTRHLVQKDEAGCLTVNRKSFGDVSTIEALVAMFCTEPLPQGWPVLLRDTVNGESGAIVPMGSAPVWLHGVSQGKTADAARLLDPATSSYPSGRFFVVVLDSTSTNYPGWAMMLAYKGKPTRHLINTSAEDGMMRVNKKKYGEFSTLRDLIDALSTDPPPQGWPVQLTETLDEQSGTVVSLRPQESGPDSDNAALAAAAAAQEEVVNQRKAVETLRLQHAALKEQARVAEASRARAAHEDSEKERKANAAAEEERVRRADEIAERARMEAEAERARKAAEAARAKLAVEEEAEQTRLAEEARHRAAAAVSDSAADDVADKPFWYHPHSVGGKGDKAKLRDPHSDELATDGTFFVCPIPPGHKHAPGWFLHVAFAKAKGTLHLIKEGDTGDLILDLKFDFGHDTLESLVTALTNPDLGPDVNGNVWPVPLTAGLDRDTSERVPLARSGSGLTRDNSMIF